MNGTSRVGGRLTALGFGLLVLGCGGVEVKLDNNSGGDAARDQAMAVFIDRTVTDRLDGQDGDHTDWKYVDVLDKGRLRIEVSVDTPENLKGAQVEMTDAFGNRLDRQLVGQGQTNYVFAREVEKTPDKFYVRVFAEDGRSVYTVGTTLAYAPEPAPPPVAVAPPPEETASKPKPRKRRARRARKPKPKPKPKPPPVTTPDPPPAVAPATITGRVVRIIPAKDDQSVQVTILLKGNDRVSGRVSATAYKGGARLGSVKILSNKGKQLVGRIDLPPGQVTGSIKVKFVPR